MLKIETGYTNKTTGEFVQYKCNDRGEIVGRMKVAGKLMDIGEQLKFKVLVDGIRVTSRDCMVDGKSKTIESYSMFVKRYSESPSTPDAAFNIELSPQVYKAILRLNPLKGDIITIRRRDWKNEKTGAILPVVDASVDKSVHGTSAGYSTPSAVSKTPPPEMADFVKAYEAQANPNTISLNHFIGTYMLTFLKNDVSMLVETFNKHFVKDKGDGQ